MLAEAMTVLAAAGGSAVVQAAGTDAWEGLRSRLAQWFGRGDAAREHGELERLECSAAELEAAGPGVADRVRTRQEAVWATRIENLLEDLDDDEQRAQAADQLQQLLEEAAPAPAGNGGVHDNTFNGQTAFVAGDHGTQHVQFGPQP